MKKAFYIYYLNKKLNLDKNIKYYIGRNPECNIVIDDPYVSRIHAKLIWAGNTFCILDCNSTNGVFMFERRISERELDDGDVFRIGNSYIEFHLKKFSGKNGEIEELPPGELILLEKEFAHLINKINDNPMATERLKNLKVLINTRKRKVNDLVYRDKLTGLYNRRYYDEILLNEVLRASRYKRPLSLIMIDIDYFKKFNDKYGHQKGDNVLKTVSSIIVENSRDSDIVARYGGEEISIILPETSESMAFSTAEKIRVKVEEEAKRRECVKITVSIGISEYDGKSESVDGLIKNTDKALYSAKNSGRNRVIKYK